MAPINTPNRRQRDENKFTAKDRVYQAFLANHDVTFEEASLAAGDGVKRVRNWLSEARRLWKLGVERHRDINVPIESVPMWQKALHLDKARKQSVNEIADRDTSKSVPETQASVIRPISPFAAQEPPPANHDDMVLGNSASHAVAVEPILLSSEEGKRLLKVHSRIERKPQLTREKKRLAKLKDGGRLICACCGFEYVAVYGSLGDDFIECHHTQPLGSRLESMETKLEDLVLVCANCHRMLHRGTTLLTVDELRDRMNQEFRHWTRGFFERRP